MNKSEVYSWRLSPELKAALEEAARDERSSVSEILERMARDWLRQKAAGDGGEEGRQERLRASALRFVGTLKGGDAHRAERARHRLRQRLARGR